ncbi:MAG: helix-turn-helix domain-containing protein [bacterium]|nr:helix-turn-helix domain-containing protein [bacterium]
MSLSFLQSFNLSENEITLYELLLKLGESPAAVLVKGSKLKRPTVYKNLYSLEEKGLVSQKEINKKINFRPEPPTKLAELANQQYQNLDRARSTLQSVLSQLSSEYVLSVERPIIKIYEGVEGIKKAHLELLAEKKEIVAYVKINRNIDKQLGSFWKKYYRIRIRDGILAKVISLDDKEGREYQKKDKEEMRITRLISPKIFSTDIEKDVVGDKVAFFSRQRGKLIVTIIVNREIAETERAVFNLIWEKAN